MEIEQIFQKIPYPGRFIIAGQVKEEDVAENVIIYGLTGRSPPSKARTLEIGANDAVRTEATDYEALKNGNPNLLLYTAIWPRNDFVVASNGVQTMLPYNLIRRAPSIALEDALNMAFKEPFLMYDPQHGEVDITSYEPDSLRTPRITVVTRHDEGAFHIVRAGEKGEPIRRTQRFALEPGRGLFLSTYQGSDSQNPESFSSDPLPVELNAATPEDAVARVYGALRQDLRVGVAAHYMNRETPEKQSAIKNLHPPKE